MLKSLLSVVAVGSMLTLAPLSASAVPIISPGVPFTIDPGPPEVVVLPIEITGAVNLVTWQFDLTFDPSVVQVNTFCDPFTDQFCDLFFGPVTEGLFTSSNGLFQTLFIPGVVDNVTGLVSIVAGAYVDLPPGPSGNGVLAYIEFLTLDPTGDPGFTIDGESTTAIPEPATFALLASGLAALRWRSRVPGAAAERRNRQTEGE